MIQQPNTKLLPSLEQSIQKCWNHFAFINSGFCLYEVQSIYLPSPSPPQAGCNTKSIFKRSKVGFEFSVSFFLDLARLKTLVCLTIYP